MKFGKNTLLFFMVLIFATAVLAGEVFLGDTSIAPKIRMVFIPLRFIFRVI